MDRYRLKDTKGVEVQRGFGRSRVAGEWMASAYERLVPVERRPVGRVGPQGSGPASDRSAGVEGPRWALRA